MKRILGGLILIGVVLLATRSAYAVASLTALGTAYTQNFNTLANSGVMNPWTNDGTINGWYAEDGGGPVATYRAGAGTWNGGDLYSYGANGSTERALGSISSNPTGDHYIGVRLRNDTGATIPFLYIAYYGEQWRDSNNIDQQKLEFAYRTGATVTDLTSGTWTDVDALDFTGPQATGVAGALDGNAPANRQLRESAIAVNLAAGDEIMLRWHDPNDPLNDHGLAVDDLTVLPTAPTAAAWSGSSLHVDPAQAQVGATIRYRLTIANGGTPAVFVVSDELDSCLRLIDADGMQVANRTLTARGAVGPGERRTFTIVAQVQPACSAVISNSATISGVDGALRLDAPSIVQQSIWYLPLVTR